MTTMARVARLELLTGAVLVAATLANVLWCEWSVPIHGALGPHGVETGACNWGIYILRTFAVVAGLPLLVFGGVALWRSGSPRTWLACQLSLGAALAVLIASGAGAL